MNEKTLTFLKEKETKGTFRFAEVGKDGVIHLGTIYVRKSSPLSSANILTVKIVAEGADENEKM